MTMTYSSQQTLSAQQFIDLLKASGLGERRPIDDRECVQGMLDQADLTITAWDGETLVGVARSVTDFHYACYLSDLAVAKSHQSKGIGKSLLDSTRGALKPGCKLILLSAPMANDYYPKLGFENNPRCWVMD